MITLMENFYDQIIHEDLLKKDKIQKNVSKQLLNH